MKRTITTSATLAVALLLANTGNALEVKNLLQKNSKGLNNAQVAPKQRAQSQATAQLALQLFAKLKTRFAASAQSDEEAFEAIEESLLSVQEIQNCVETELAASYGIFTPLQCFAPPEEPEEPEEVSAHRNFFIFIKQNLFKLI